MPTAELNVDAEMRQLVPPLFCNLDGGVPAQDIALAKGPPRTA